MLRRAQSLVFATGPREHDKAMTSIIAGRMHALAAVHEETLVSRLGCLDAQSSSVTKGRHLVSCHTSYASDPRRVPPNFWPVVLLYCYCVVLLCCRPSPLPARLQTSRTDTLLLGSRGDATLVQNASSCMLRDARLRSGGSALCLCFVSTAIAAHVVSFSRRLIQGRGIWKGKQGVHRCGREDEDSRQADKHTVLMTSE